MKSQLESPKTANTSDDRRLTPTGFLIRLAIYSSVTSSMLLPFFQNHRIMDFNILDGAAKAKESEGKNFIGAINRSQMAYYLDNGTFTDSIEKLKVGLPSEGPNYRYQIWVDPQQGPFQFSNDRAFSPRVIVTATARRQNLKSFSGVVSLDRADSQNPKTISGICQTLQPSQVPPLFPSVSQTKYQSQPIVHCPKRSKPL